MIMRNGVNHLFWGFTGINSNCFWKTKSGVPILYPHKHVYPSSEHVYPSYEGKGVGHPVTNLLSNTSFQNIGEFASFLKKREKQAGAEMCQATQ